MKNITLKSAAFVAALTATIAWSHTTQARDFKPYMGIDLQRFEVDYNNNYSIGGGLALDGSAILEDSLDSFNIHGGNRFHKRFGLELGYFRTKEEGRNIPAGSIIGPGLPPTAVSFSTDVRIQGVTLDALGYFPVGKEERVELIGTAGLSWMNAEVTGTVPGVGSANADESEVGFRAGGGAQVNLTDKVNLRGLVRYQSMDFDNVADSAWIYSVGLNYNF